MACRRGRGVRRQIAKRGKWGATVRLSNRARRTAGRAISGTRARNSRSRRVEQLKIRREVGDLLAEIALNFAGRLEFERPPDDGFGSLAGQMSRQLLHRRD